MSERLFFSFLRASGMAGIGISGLAWLWTQLSGDWRVELTALILLSLAIVLTRVGHTLLESDGEILSPILIFLYFFAFFHLAFPAFQIFYFGVSELTKDYFTKPLYVTLIGLLALETALTLYRPRAVLIPETMHIDHGVLLLVPLAFYAVAGTGTVLNMFGGAQLGYIIALIAMVIWQRVPGQLTRCYAIALILSSIAMSLGEFTRAFVGQVFLIILFYINFYYRRLSLLSAAVLGLSIFPIMLLGAVFRTAFRNPALQGSSDNFFSVLAYAWKLPWELLEDKAGVYFMLSEMDFPLVYEAYSNIVSYVPEYIDYMWGLTYYRVAFMLIPRSLWPDKPENLTAQYVWEFVDPGWRSHSSGIGLLGELYWNGGILAIVIGMFFCGMGLRFLQGNMRSFVRNPFTFALFASFLLIIPQLMRGGTTSLLVYALIWKFFPIVVIFFAISAAPRLFREAVRRSGHMVADLKSGRLWARQKRSPQN